MCANGKHPQSISKDNICSKSVSYHDDVLERTLLLQFKIIFQLFLSIRFLLVPIKISNDVLNTFLSSYLCPVPQYRQAHFSL